MSSSLHYVTGLGIIRPELVRFSWHPALLFFVAALASLSMMTNSALAQDRTISPIFEFGVDFEDNPRLVDDSLASDIFGGQLKIGLDFLRRTDTSSVSLRPSADVRSYTGNGDNNSENYYLNLGLQNQGQRSEWRLSADYRQEEVRQGELPTAGIDDPDIGDATDSPTGFIQEKRQRDRAEISPGVSFDLTEKVSLNLDFSYLDVSYDRQTATRAVDFSDARFETSVTRDMTEYSDFRVGVFGSRYETDDAFNLTKSVGLLGRYTKSISERSTLYFEAGVQESDVEFVDGQGITTSSSETVPFLSAGMDRTWERTRLRIALDHIAAPSGTGFLLERNQARVTIDRQVRPRWSVQVSGVGLTTETLSSTNLAFNDVTLFDSRFTVAYELSRKWVLRGFVSYRYRDDKNEIGTQHSIGANLSIAYRPIIQLR